MFVSIRWKALLLLTFILIVIMSFGTAIVLIKQHSAFDDVVIKQSKLHQNIVSKLLDDQKNSILPLSQLFSFQIDSTSSKTSEFNQVWQKIAEKSSIDYLAIFDQNTDLIASKQNRGYTSQASNLEKHIQAQLSINLKHQAEQFLYCSQGCMQVVLLASTDRYGKPIYIAVGQSLTHLIEAFSHFTGDEMGVLLPSENKQDVKAARVATWNLSVWALSHFEKSLPALTAFAKANTFGYGLKTFEQDDLYLVFQAHHFDLPSYGKKPVIFSLVDFSDNRRVLDDSVSFVINAGVYGLILAVLFSYLLIVSPIRRMIRISKALELLPKFEYEKAKGLLNQRPLVKSKDEVSTLEDSANFATQALQTYQKEIEEKSQSLENQIQVIGRSKNFLTRLLDSADLFIVTQTFDGEVRLRNKRIEQLLEATDGYFPNIFESADHYQFFEALLDLQSGKNDTVTHEMEVLTLKGNMLFVNWSHSVVDDEQGEKVVLSIGTDLTRRKEAEKALSWLAHNDPLTQINNRRGFQERINSLCENEEPFALVLLDINRFKQINDLFGHSTGDKVLIDVAEKLKTVTRFTDHISRLAADEFVIILTGLPYKNLEVTLRKISPLLNGKLLADSGREVAYEVSLGAAYHPLHAEDPEQLIINADLALLHAKKSESQFHVFNYEDGHLDTIQTEHSVTQMIKSSLENNLFVLNFQPIQTIGSGNIKHYEVLIRMQKSDGSIVMPDTFISVAERTGFISQIDEWVIDNALAFLAQKRAQPEHAELVFSINVSAPSLQSPKFYQCLRAHLIKHKLPASAIIVELTETAYIENFSQTLSNLVALNHHGVKIAMDDFGVGFSSFSYLKKMPLSYVKLDGSYIQNLTENEDDQIFVKSLSDMVRGFGMQTIAEFVDNEATLAMLQELNVSYAQGRHIGKPLPELIQSK